MPARRRPYGQVIRRELTTFGCTTRSRVTDGARPPRPGSQLPWRLHQSKCNRVMRLNILLIESSGGPLLRRTSPKVRISVTELSRQGDANGFLSRTIVYVYICEADMGSTFSSSCHDHALSID